MQRGNNSQNRYFSRRRSLAEAIRDRSSQLPSYQEHMEMMSPRYETPPPPYKPSQNISSEYAGIPGEEEDTLIDPQLRFLYSRGLLNFVPNQLASAPSSFDGLRAMQSIRHNAKNDSLVCREDAMEQADAHSLYPLRL